MCELKLLNQKLRSNFLNRKNVFRLRFGFSLWLCFSVSENECLSWVLALLWGGHTDLTPLQPCAADTKRREAQKFLILSLMGSTIILHCPGFFENCNLYYAAGFVNSLGSPTWLIFPCESVDDLTPCWAVVWGFPCVPSTPWRAVWRGVISPNSVLPVFQTWA